MARRNRECLLCGERYTYCPTCGVDQNKPYWMSEFHSEDCKNIFQICTNFNLGIMSKHEAQAALEQCDLSNKENFKDYVQKDFENIYAEEPKKRNKKAEMPIIEEAPMEQVHEVVEE